MTEMLDQIRRVGWRIAETGLLVVILCLLLNILLGAEGSGDFVSSVARNANAFLQGLPGGTLVGLLLILLAYRLVRPKVDR